MTQGIVYVATGEEFVKEAQLSAESVRETMGEIPIALVSDEARTAEIFDEVIILENPTNGFRDKILGVQRTPFERTVFLDTDTLMRKDFDELFELLNRFDIAATHNQNRDLYTGQPAEVPDSFPEYSSGIIAFEKRSTIRLFERWLEIYDGDSHPGDQPSFRKALYEEDVRIATLPREYNYSPRYPGHVVKEITVFHGRLLDINTPGAEKSDNLHELMDRMNETSGHRVFAPGGFQLWPELSFIQAAENSIRHRGVIGTIRAGFEYYL